ncbi:MAG: hypothetical protein AAF726_03725 [Planctomycetota bacterium]
MKLSVLCLSAALVASIGCAVSPTAPDETAEAEAPDRFERVLRVDGESVILGQAASTPLSLRGFVLSTQQSAAAGRDEEVGRSVRTYPDLARQAVLSAEVDPSWQQTIAAWLDGDASPGRGGWSLFVTDRSENPGRYAAWAEQRAQAWASLRRGEFAEVADRELTPPVDGPTPWPGLEAASMRATAMLAAGRPAEAAELFDRTAEEAADWDARIAVRSKLFASLSFQLAGSMDAASRARKDAVSATSLEAVHDPTVLRLLLETEDSAAISMGDLSARSIRARLGRLEMERGAPQAALLAWRSAENERGTEPTRNRLRLNQARALIALGQDQPAVAMLAGLASTDVRSEALAMLGLVQLQRGQVDMAMAVFREAVRNTSSDAHPDVYADAGLALLSAGNRDVGLSLLHEARDVYRARADTSALRQLLTNELRYAQAVGDGDLTDEVRQQLLEESL